MEKIGEHVPDTVHFSIGYFEHKLSKKRWLCCQDDLQDMYECFKDGGEVTLWCDAKKSVPTTDEQPGTSAQKRKHDNPVTSKRQEKEDQVDSIYSDLRETWK